MYKLIGADGKEYGPISAEIVRLWISEGRANGLTRVLPENATEWKLLRDLPEFAASLPAAPAPGTPAPFPVTPQEEAKTNPLAITGLILGIVSLTIGPCCCSGLPVFSIPGVICSAIALAQTGKDRRQGGRGMAIAGLILSILGLLIGIGFMIFVGIASSMPDVMRRIQNL